VACVRAEPRALDGIDVRATSFRDVSHSHLLDQKVCRLLEVQCLSAVRFVLDKGPCVRYNSDNGVQEQGWPLSPAKKTRPASTRTT
jgi:hypothetical protein